MVLFFVQFTCNLGEIQKHGFLGETKFYQVFGHSNIIQVSLNW